LAEAFRAIGKSIPRAAAACVLLLAFGQGAMGQNLEGSAEIARTESMSPLPTSSSPGAEPTEQSELLRNVDGALDEIDRMIEGAYFRTALGMVEKRRDRLNELGPVRALKSRRARLEVLAATAEVALDLRLKAMRSMRRALRADPSLTLDERRTPPKVYALLREARAGRTFRSKR